MHGLAAAEDEIRLLHTVRLHMNQSFFSDNRTAQTLITCAGSAFLQHKLSLQKVMTPSSGYNLYSFYFLFFRFSVCSKSWCFCLLCLKFLFIVVIAFLHFAHHIINCQVKKHFYSNMHEAKFIISTSS